MDFRQADNAVFKRALHNLVVTSGESEAFGLKANTEKTKVMNITANDANMWKFRVEGTILEEVEHVKCLGAQIGKK